MITTSYSSEQMEEVWSWVHDERQCVTSFSVAMRLGVSRMVASSLLRDLPLHQGTKDDIMYEVTKAKWMEQEFKNGIKQTVIQLVADITNTVSDDSVVYSIAIQGSQNLLTAHEMQKINPLTLDCHVLSTDLNTARIAPAMDIARISLGVGRFANMELPDTVPATNTFSAKHRKTTTAASFFGKDETNDKKTVTMTKNDNPPIETNTVEPRKVKTAKIIEVKKPPKKSIFGNTPISKPIPTKERLPNDKKENTTTKVAGTADDFIGDDDEDEDFLAEEQDRKRRNQIQRKDTEQKERRREEEAMAVRAAIERKQGQEEPINEQPQKSKKRRKRLVEKTTMDANGYLRTETQAIWEEVSDEDEVVVKKVPVKKVPAKNGMKQGSLMGFFGKK